MVEIILIRYNNKKVEDKAIECVKKYTEDYKLTVYDNYPENKSLSSIWNEFIEKSDCEYICLLNSDAFVTKGWLSEMLKGFEEDVIAVGPSGQKVLGEQGSMTELGAKKRKNLFVDLFPLSGFCLLIRKTDIKFPEEVPFYGGEHAWEIEAKRQGWRTVWAKGAFVEHIGEASSINTLKLRESGVRDYVKWLAKTTPVLFTTYNRLGYTKKSLRKLIESNCGEIIVIDNNSTDKTKAWLRTQENSKLHIIYNKSNEAVAGAMNQFFDLTKNEEWVAKVDNDTIVPKDWLEKLLYNAITQKVDIVQAKHPLLHETTNGLGFNDWTKKLKQVGTISLNSFVGGSGTIIKRSIINEKLDGSAGVLSGWVSFQKKHPEISKGFDASVEIELLDTDWGGIKKYDKYKDYYKETGRDVKPFNKLDVGCGNFKHPGYITIDVDPSTEPDILADIEDRIPCNDETFDEIRCHHILEHIETKNKVKVLGELWRVLKKDGILDIEVPNFPSVQSVQDPTHVSFWCSESFRYFIQGDSLYENFKDRYSQYHVPTFKRISEELESGWIYRTRLQKISPAKKRDIQFICPSNDKWVLRNNLLRSKILESYPLKVQRDYTNISKAYNDFKSDSEIRVYLHHDVFLPDDFEENLLKGIEKIEETDPNWGVIGVAGVRSVGDGKEIYGYISDRGKKWGKPDNLPHEVDTLDELLLIVKDKKLKFDENIPSTHFYGADICLQAQEMGKKNYAINAYCEHNSSLGEKPAGFYAARDYIMIKYKNKRPIATTCTIIKSQ